jgi:hypothetical protein
VALDSIAAAVLGIALGYLVYRPRELPEGRGRPAPLAGSGLYSAQRQIQGGRVLCWRLWPFKALAQFLAYTLDGRFWHDWFHGTAIGSTQGEARILADPLTWASLTVRSTAGAAG